MGNQMTRLVDAGPYPIIIGDDVLEMLPEMLAEKDYSQILVLTDTNTHALCRPHFERYFPEGKYLTIQAGEAHKTLNSCQQLWQHMTEARVDRKALVLNLGGGMIGDLGGYTASCYKRGIDFMQIPTSLLSMVDASAGGKTGVNFDHYKNQIGLFSNPQAVFIDPKFLDTLPQRELKSGFAELLKHCLIRDAERWHDLSARNTLPDDWTNFIADSIQVKVNIVREDPFEQGPRKALNFGHTIGHAVESYLMDSNDNLLHGEAVALGMVAEAAISVAKDLLSEDDRDQIRHAMLCWFGHRPLPADSFEQLIFLALQDKKNQGGQILCTLLDGIGDFRINVPIDADDIRSALHYYNTTP